jgi:hypothetical protein
MNPTSGTFSNADVDTSEDLATIKTWGCERLAISFVVGAANLSAFTVEYQFNSDGGWASIASATANYTTPAGVIIKASGDLTGAASGSTVHYLILDVRGAYAVRLKAAGTSSTVTGHYGAI